MGSDGEPLEPAFIIREKIRRYQTLLSGPDLSPAERRAVAGLLAEAAMKLRRAQVEGDQTIATVQLPVRRA